MRQCRIKKTSNGDSVHVSSDLPLLLKRVSFNFVKLYSQSASLKKVSHCLSLTKICDNVSFGKRLKLNLCHFPKAQNARLYLSADMRNKGDR